jgi:hypothetical protein
MKKRRTDALTLLRSIRDSLSGTPSFEAASAAWYALDDLKISLIRDAGHSRREMGLVRDLHAAMLHLTSDLQQQREPNCDPVKMITVALQSSIIGRSVRGNSELILSEDDVLAE